MLACTFEVHEEVAAWVGFEARRSRSSTRSRRAVGHQIGNDALHPKPQPHKHSEWKAATSIIGLTWMVDASKCCLHNSSNKQTNKTNKQTNKTNKIKIKIKVKRADHIVTSA